MDSPNSNRTVIASARQQSRSREWQIVLAAAGIASTVQRVNGHWQLEVNQIDAVRASEELSDFQLENASGPISINADDLELEPRNINRTDGNRHYPGAVIGVVVFLMIITLLQVFSTNATWNIPWFQGGCMNAGEVRSGQWWRAVTALLLHRDALHLLSNALFGSIFGYLVGKNVGGGAGWLAILLSGSLGNFLNAYTRPVEHTSVGVSTAVFGALGILMAQAIQPKTTASSSWKRYSPLVGGMLLFFYLGIGDEHTDTAAHFYGLVSGLLIGIAFRSLPTRILQKVDGQVWFGIAGLSIMIAAWSLAIVTV